MSIYHSRIKSISSAEYNPLSGKEGSFDIKIVCNISIKVFPLPNGKSPVISSISIRPKLQMSLEYVYGLPSTRSGDLKLAKTV